MAPAPWPRNPTKVAHIAIITIFSLFALLAVIGRLWARKIRRHTLDASDYFIVMALLWALTSSINTVYSQIYFDLGGDRAQIGNPNVVQSLRIEQGKRQIVGIVVWAVAVFFIRASILVLYTRIFQTRSFRISCYLIHSFNTAFFVTAVLLPCLICRPISFRWNSQIPGGTCGNQKALDLYIGVVNFMLDAIMVILPMPVLWGLQMATNKKVMLSLIFGLGAVICIITIVRVCISAENHGFNSQEVYRLIALFTNLEELLGIVNACLPVMKPLYSKFHESRARSWLSSVMSGSISIVMRLSHMGTIWRSSSQGASSKANSTSKHPSSKEMRRWHGHSNRVNDFDGGFGPTAKDMPPPAPRYVNTKPARMMFGPSQSAMSTSSTGSRTPRPSLPSKGPVQSSIRRWEPADEKDGMTPGIYVQKSWHLDVEKRASDEIDRHLLKDSSKRDYEDR
ncbi:hypothetical protein N7G274_004027 [Stereocaulon virgatum]|uniref:Rhodopsin domain-containing protein n=1 Tax=Stereocaulon virgatum TaxID=373712 RepID=A0ABR4ABX0_9LECA